VGARSDAGEIDRALKAGDSFGLISARTGVNKGGLYRHKTRCLGVSQASETAETLAETPAPSPVTPPAQAEPYATAKRVEDIAGLISLGQWKDRLSVVGLAARWGLPEEEVQRLHRLAAAKCRANRGALSAQAEASVGVIRELRDDALAEAAYHKRAKMDALAPQSKTNRQGRDVQCLDDTQAAQVLELLRDDATRNYAHYQELLNEDDQGQVIDPQRDGLARELARMNLTLNYYTQWYWKIDLHNLLHFLSLRMDGHAQYEMRLYANAIGDMVKAWVPDAWEAFIDYRFEAKTFSRMELEALRAMLAGQTPDLKALGLTSREIGEFEAKLKR
jgi:hypothetical protein